MAATPEGGVPPIEPTPPVAPPVPVPPVEAAPVVPAAARVDPYASAQPNYAAPPTTPLPPPTYATPPAYGTPPVYATPPTYGNPAQARYYQPQQPQGPMGLSIAALILGIAGVFFSFAAGFGIFPSIAGVITGHIGYAKQPRGRGLALGGLICGYVGILLSLIFIAFLILGIVLAVQAGSFSGSDYGDY